MIGRERIFKGSTVYLMHTIYFGESNEDKVCPFSLVSVCSEKSPGILSAAVTFDVCSLLITCLIAHLVNR